MQLGMLAERYFHDDPPTALFKLRQFAELLSKTVAANHALYRDERETFEEALRRLSFERSAGSFGGALEWRSGHSGR